MKPVRPASVLVLAILNIVFGSIGVLFFGLCGLSLTVYAFAAGNPWGQNTYGELQRVGGPAVTAYLFVQPSCTLIFTALLLTSGIGLLWMKPWARWLAIVYALYCTLMSLTVAVFQVVLHNPVSSRVLAERAPAMQRAQNPLYNPMFWNVVSVGVAGVYLTFAFVTLVILFLPSVRAAFAAASAARREQER